jgi:hypothetical protein
MKNESQEKVLSIKDVCVLLGVCKTTLSRMNIPRVKVRRRVFYQQSALIGWLEKNSITKGA